MALTKKQRDALPAEHFAVPGKRALPMNDETHTRLAWDMVDRTHGLSDEERNTARTRIKRRAKEIGIDTSDWDRALQHSAALVLEAMSLQIPHVADHPNRMPFSGVMTRVDTPSDKAVGGSGGYRTLLPRVVAEAALPSLLGMPIDFNDDFDGHDVRQKIGTITAATIEGDAIKIEGFFYAADFPQECARIQQEKEVLGFSYEIQARTEVVGEVLKIISGVFTGAAVLRKDKAAYQTTSLAAQAELETTMTKEEFEALFTAQLKPVTDTLAKVTADVAALSARGDSLQANQAMRERVAPHATALRNCAAGMEAAGIGLNSNRGHVRVLHHMAASMEADAASGRLPHIYRDHDWSFSHSADNRTAAPAVAPALKDDPAFKAVVDTLSGLGTKLDDLKASAFRASAAPERKTIPAELTALLAKGGIAETPKGGLTETQLDQVFEKAGIAVGQKTINLKLQFAQAGLLAR